MPTYTVVPNPHLRPYVVPAWYRRAWHRLRHWCAAPRPRVVVTDPHNNRLYTHPDNVAVVTEYLRQHGHPYTVAPPTLQVVGDAP